MRKPFPTCPHWRVPYPDVSLDAPGREAEACPECGTMSEDYDTTRNIYICDACGYRFKGDS